MTILVTIPVRTQSESNMREHWAAKNRRAKAQFEAVCFYLNPKIGGTGINGDVWVTLTRIAPRALDAHDNLTQAMKKIADTVAWIVRGKPVELAWDRKGEYYHRPAMGRDDGKGMHWSYGQEKSGKSRYYAVRIEISAQNRVNDAS